MNMDELGMNRAWTVHEVTMIVSIKSMKYGPKVPNFMCVARENLVCFKLEHGYVHAREPWTIFAWESAHELCIPWHLTTVKRPRLLDHLSVPYIFWAFNFCVTTFCRALYLIGLTNAWSSCLRHVSLKVTYQFTLYLRASSTKMQSWYM